MVESIKLSFEKQKINLPVVDKLQSILIVCRDKKLSCPLSWDLKDCMIRLNLLATIKVEHQSQVSSGQGGGCWGWRGVLGVEQ